MRAGLNQIRYRPSILPSELRKGLRVYDVRSGFIIYTDRAVPYRGGWVDARLGPRFDPRTNAPEA